jgi:hypothetical protein
MRHLIHRALPVMAALTFASLATAQEPPPPAAGATGVTAPEVHVGTGVTNHAIDGEATTFSKATTHRVFVLVKLGNSTGAEGTVTVAVERPGQASHGGGVSLQYPAARRYTTYARIPITNRAAGHYRAVVRDSTGAELGAAEFDVTD